MTKQCSCEATVSDAYFRVFSANDGVLYGCPECLGERGGRDNPHSDDAREDGHNPYTGHTSTHRATFMD